VVDVISGFNRDSKKVEFLSWMDLTAKGLTGLSETLSDRIIRWVNLLFMSSIVDIVNLYIDTLRLYFLFLYKILSKKLVLDLANLELAAIDVDGSIPSVLEYSVGIVNCLSKPLLETVLLVARTFSGMMVLVSSF